MLEDAFIALLGEKDFDAVTVQDITDRAMVNRMTFYAHFTDKYDMLARLLRKVIRRKLEFTVSIESPFNASNLHLITTAVFIGFAEFRDRRVRKREEKRGYEIRHRQELQK